MTTLATATTYNRPAIMAAAWKLARSFMAGGRTMRNAIAAGLRFAWGAARAQRGTARRAAGVETVPAEPQPMTLAQMREAVAIMEARNHLSPADLSRLDALHRDLAAAEAKDRAEKRERIEAGKGKIIAVTFTKKDGTPRTIQVQPAALKSRVKGEAASESAQRAAQTRKANHPNLFNVWDVAKNAPRSINLDTVTRIAAGGEVHTYA